MKTKLLTFFLALAATTALWASNTITYTATEKLPEVTNDWEGLHTNAFNVVISSHEFSNGVGTITFAGDVTTIGERAFCGCWELTSVTIPNSVTTIGDEAFYGCSGLTSIIIPNSVTTIGYEAFYGCSGLTSIIIPNSVTTIGSSAFSGCTSLPVENNIRYADTYLIEAVDKTLSTYTIKDGTKWIGHEAFSGCSSLTSITIPNSVTTIGYDAFESCSGLTSITIPNSVTTIGSYAFEDCSGLTSVTIECTLPNNSSTIFRNCPISSVTIGEEVQYLPSELFGYSYDEKTITSVTWNAKNCSTQSTSGFYIFGKQVKSFVFGNNVKVIPSRCCSGMTNLTSMVIPNSVDSVGYSAFYGCTGLVMPVYNKNVFAFMPTSYIGAYIVPQGIKQIASNAFGDCTGLTEVTIPNSVTTIGESAFDGCSGLTSITIPNSVTTIGYDSFVECYNLASITAPAICFDIDEFEWYAFPKQLTNVIVNGGELNENELLFINRSYKTLKTLDVSAVTNTEFADEAFKGYYNLESLVLPQSLERVGYMMVAGCKNLKSIDIPASVIEIDQSAFEDCRSIKTITFGGVQPSKAPAMAEGTASALRKIGNWAFYNAHELQNLELPEGVEEIGEGAFYGCVYMEDLVLPRSTKSIGDNTFALCSKLSKITVRSTTPPTIATKTFYDVKRQIPVYVPIEVVEAYKQAEYWKEFNIIGVEMPTDLKSVHGSQPTMHKVLRNGQILLERNNATYTLVGQKVR